MFLCAIVICQRFSISIFFSSSFLLCLTYLPPQTLATQRQWDEKEIFFFFFGFCHSEEAITSINDVSLSAFMRGRDVMNKYRAYNERRPNHSELVVGVKSAQPFGNQLARFNTMEFACARARMKIQIVSLAFSLYQFAAFPFITVNMVNLVIWTISTQNIVRIIFMAVRNATATATAINLFEYNSINSPSLSLSPSLFSGRILRQTSGLID